MRLRTGPRRGRRSPPQLLLGYTCQAQRLGTVIERRHAKALSISQRPHVRDRRAHLALAEALALEGEHDDPVAGVDEPLGLEPKPVQALSQSRNMSCNSSAPSTVRLQVPAASPRARTRTRRERPPLPLWRESRLGARRHRSPAQLRLLGHCNPIIRGASQLRYSSAASANVAPVFNHARERPAARLLEHIGQPGLRRALREAAGLRPAARRPRWPDPPLSLAPVRQSVLRVPDGTARTLAAENVPARSKRVPRRWRCHDSQRKAIVGAKLGRSFVRSQGHHQEKPRSLGVC
jgi:hypothetical protein